MNEQMNKATKTPQPKAQHQKMCSVTIWDWPMHQTRTLNATTSLEVYIHNSQGGNPPNPAMKIDENFYLHSVDVLDERITEGTRML